MLVNISRILQNHHLKMVDVKYIGEMIFKKSMKLYKNLKTHNIMNQKPHTAVEWLIDQMFKQGYFDGNKPLTYTNLDHLQQQALELERLQHSQTWDAALDKYEVRAGNYMRAYEDFDDYYEQNNES
jgi:hypothetical protein